MWRVSHSFHSSNICRKKEQLYCWHFYTCSFPYHTGSRFNNSCRTVSYWFVWERCQPPDESRSDSKACSSLFLLYPNSVTTAGRSSKSTFLPILIDDAVILLRYSTTGPALVNGIRSLAHHPTPPSSHLLFIHLLFDIGVEGQTNNIIFVQFFAVTISATLNQHQNHRVFVFSHSKWRFCCQRSQ